jgi:hypothetical protein
MSAGGLVSLNGAERSRYEALFLSADGDKDGVIGPADAAWFLTLGLDKTTLSEVTPPIWINHSSSKSHLLLVVVHDCFRRFIHH